MINQLRTYEKEALECDAIIMATLLNPRLRMKFLELYHPSTVCRAQQILEQQMGIYSNLYQVSKPITDSSKQQDITVTDDDYNVFGSLPLETENESVQEIEGYMSGKFPLSGGSILSWWKDNQGAFPVLAILARDFLACPATTCSAERLFSGAADVCGSDRSALSSRGIERSSSTREWLKSGIEVPGEFAEALVLVQNMEKR